ncbi:VRR-NUC domain-containing protein [Nitrincola tibetensis]|uniref:phosphodiesterase I n=1 Tax=Nitrincola tibetensis TaxID=2219697 RepID=A0A364NSB4_9GAMM|nr:VRR-NUC domain-containing protein [Nitrincola tibetensis]RAU19922.1 VRR-NUC domain-containing protein [Nitrincola tibetensis]
MNISSLTPTSLDNPLYYLRNAQQVTRICLNHYADLLLPIEHRALEQLLSMDEAYQALLIRMVMRKGELFRTDALHYAEVPDLDEAIQALVDAGLITAQPKLTIEELCSMSRRGECRILSQYLLPTEQLPSSISKTHLINVLLASFSIDQTQPLNDWWPEAPFAIIKLTCQNTFDRLQLMFFGNLHQGWSEFVLTELGLQKFESVPLTPESRPFQSRSEVDLYLQLYQIQDQSTQGASIETLSQSMPPAIGCDWIDYRRQKVLFILGREAERQQQTALALDLYQQSQHREAQLRALRLLEKRESPEQVFQWTKEAYDQIAQPEIRIGLQRIQQRCARKAKIEFSVPDPIDIPIESVLLPRNDQSRVEMAVISSLSDANTELFHVENRLFIGLFALLFWPALFAPIRGAFFNPFQSSPADLYRPRFNEQRSRWLDEGFIQLKTGHYRHVILQRLEQKRGISCSLIHWPSLPSSLVESVLAIIPAAHLAAIFQHLLLDLRNHRRGMPDLILLNHAKQLYQLIEIKGPGDRLQDHQRLWIQTMLQQGIPVSVLKVQWDN